MILMNKRLVHKRLTSKVFISARIDIYKLIIQPPLSLSVHYSLVLDSELFRSCSLIIRENRLRGRFSICKPVFYFSFCCAINVNLRLELDLIHFRHAAALKSDNKVNCVSLSSSPQRYDFRI